MSLREMDENSVHWGGYAGVRLVVNPFDPLPSSLLGGLDVDDFLQDQLSRSLDPLAAGLGLLFDDSIDSSSASVLSAPWSVRDPSSSFYEEVFDLIFSTPTPALPSDALRRVPRFVEQTMISRGIQSTSHALPISEQSEFQLVAQVISFSVILYSKLLVCLFYSFL